MAPGRLLLDMPSGGRLAQRYRSINMDDEAQIKQFSDLTRSSFANAADETDKVMSEHGFEQDDEAYYIWFEKFADVTNNKMLSGHKNEVIEIFNFFSAQFENGSEVVRNCIDVSYVENLFWRLPKEVTRQFWPLLPESLKKLYVSFHGFATTINKISDNNAVEFDAVNAGAFTRVSPQTLCTRKILDE